MAWQPGDNANRITLHLAFMGSLIYDFGSTTGRQYITAPGNWVNNYHILEAYHDTGSVSKTFIDGSELASDTFGGVTLDNTATLTLYIGGEGSCCYLEGSIAELLVYNRSLTVEEKQKVQCYLSKKYNLAVTPTCN
ncbi:MAG: hypothetical protein H7A25_13665 [Leptospiraceae bacterium]|nr:hypothetical protein [Leptospiraceae bacterium]